MENLPTFEQLYHASQIGFEDRFTMPLRSEVFQTRSGNHVVRLYDMIENKIYLKSEPTLGNGINGIDTQAKPFITYTFRFSSSGDFEFISIDSKYTHFNQLTAIQYLLSCK